MTTMPNFYFTDVQIPEQYRDSIIAALSALWQRMSWDMREQFGFYDLPALSDEQLLVTPAAALFAEIALAAAGERQHSDAGDGELLECIQTAGELLFAVPLLNAYEIPEAFWKTELGMMIARAQIWLHHDDLLSLTEAAQLVGISRSAVHQAMDDERLTVYFNPDKRNTQPGVRMVLKSELLALWPPEKK